MTIDSVMRIKKKNDPQVFFRRIQIQNEKDKITKFIGAEIESESESELESDAELELKSELESDSNFVLNHRWLLTNFERVEKLIIILLTPSKSKLKPFLFMLICHFWGWQF